MLWDWKDLSEMEDRPESSLLVLILPYSEAYSWNLGKGETGFQLLKLFLNFFARNCSLILLILIGNRIDLARLTTMDPSGIRTEHLYPNIFNAETQGKLPLALVEIRRET